MFTMVSCLDFNCLWACTCTHACTAHKIVHAPFPPTLIISKIRHFKKMAVISLKCIKTAWLSQSGQFFGWFWGVCFFHFFHLVQYFFRKYVFLIFKISKIADLSFFGGPGGTIWIGQGRTGPVETWVGRCRQLNILFFKKKTNVL